MNVAYNMDCLEAMRKMPDKCFDLAVVDPPYGIGIGDQGGGGEQNTFHSEAEEILDSGRRGKSVRWTKVGGVGIVNPKPIPRLTTARSLTRVISKNWQEYQRRESYGGGTTSSTITARLSA